MSRVTSWGKRCVRDFTRSAATRRLWKNCSTVGAKFQIAITSVCKEWCASSQQLEQAFINLQWFCYFGWWQHRWFAEIAGMFGVSPAFAEVWTHMDADIIDQAWSQDYSRRIEIMRPKLRYWPKKAKIRHNLWLRGSWIISWWNLDGSWYFRIEKVDLGGFEGFRFRLYRIPYDSDQQCLRTYVQTLCDRNATEPPPGFHPHILEWYMIISSSMYQAGHQAETMLRWPSQSMEFVTRRSQCERCCLIHKSAARNAAVNLKVLVLQQ